MSTTKLALLGVVLLVTSVVATEEPPYKRLLQGEDEKKAAALQKQVKELWSAGKFAEAVMPAEELLALRKRVQGEGHWDAANAARQVKTLRQAAALPAEKRKALAGVPGIAAEAEALYRRGKYAEADPLFRKALAVREKVLGPRHPLTAASYSWVAVNLDAQGRAKEAEPLYRKALPVYEEVLGPRHPDTATGYNNVAANLAAQGRAKEAEPLYRKALAVREKVLGPRHPHTADSYNNLAANLDDQGRAREAEPLYRKALAIREEVQGPRHPDTALSYNNLASNLDDQGRAKEAEPLYRKALAIREEVQGPRHPDTALSYNNLAANLQAQGLAKEAEPLYRKALAIREEVLGPRHPDTASSYNSVASNLDDQGRAKEAEPLYRKALAIREEVLGPRHPLTALSYNNLAYNLQARGRAKEAEMLYRKALAVREEVLGPRHPDTARGYNNLAANLAAQGRAKEGEPLYRKALAITEEVLGPRHPSTARGYNNLASNLAAQGRAKDAEPLYRKALAVWEEVLGPRHPSTARGYNNLASNLAAQGRAKDAEPLYRKALAIREEVLGPRHPDTASSYNSVAANLDDQGRAKEAEPLYRKALAVREEVLGPRHPDTALNYNNLASNLDAQGRAREAETLLRKALAVWEEALGPRHPDTARGYNNLAGNLAAQGRAKEAEPLYRKALAVWEEVLGPRHPSTARGYNNLASNLDDQGRAKEAEPLLRKALAVWEEALGTRHPLTALSYNNLALNLQVQGRAKEAEPLWQAAALAKETARLRLASTTLDRAVAIRVQPHVGLAACRARLHRPADAWAAAEAALARGLLDDLAAYAALPADADRRDRDHAAALDALDRLLTPLLSREKLDADERHRRDDLLEQCKDLDAKVARDAADRSRKAVRDLDAVQAVLAPDEALLFWVDNSFLGEHWGCVVRHSGPPAWVSLKGSDTDGTWSKGDERLPRLLRDDLAHGEPDTPRDARRLAEQRLAPLQAHLAASGELPTARRLIVVPVGWMAGVPVEVLTERHLVSYTPSASVLVRLRQKHRPVTSPTLLALGDPDFRSPEEGPAPEPPDHGLYLTVVLPGGAAARSGLWGGDVLLRYGGVKLTMRADLKVAEAGERVPVVVWREGKLLDDLRVAPGKLGVVFSKETPAVALRQRREREQLADVRDSSKLAPLPGTRLEVAAIAALLPKDRTTLLRGSAASEQRLDNLVAAGKLKQFRLLHLATHGHVDPTSAAHSCLALARDTLPGLPEQDRLRAAGKKVPTGTLTAEAIAAWDLDADLVVLSACETAIGPYGGGEGLLGFSQVLLGRGARSLVLSLWKVNDTATALLMLRFYQNLLGEREGLKAALAKAEALQEAKQWLRTLPRAEVEKLAGKLADGVVRASEEPPAKAAPKPVVPAGDRPFAHPRYWAAFILLGDPD